MAKNPFRRRRSLQRHEHEPAAQRDDLNTRLPAHPALRWLRELQVQNRRDIAEAIAEVRREIADGREGLRTELRDEKNVRRDRYGALANRIDENRTTLIDVIGRLGRLEATLPPPDGDPAEAPGPVRLHIVPPQGRTEDAAA